MFDIDQLPHVNVPENSISAIIRTYNEIRRLPHVIDYHRKIGVSRFFIIDNASNDGTSEFIQSQNDCIYLPSSKSYRDYKVKWVTQVADTYCHNRWVLFIDADELFFYPGFPQISLNDVIKYLEFHEFDAIFCSLVDMYRSHKQNLNYNNEISPLLSSAPFFDSKGYRLVAKTRSERRRRPLPHSHIYGGPRERLFYTPRKRMPSDIDQYIIRYFMNIKNNHNEKPSIIRAFAKIAARKIVSGALPKGAPKMSKVPLLFWKRGYVFHPHDLENTLKLSPDRFALLHFKMLDDFQKKINEAVQREQHSSASRHYKIYARQDVKFDFLTEHSKQFRKVSDLEDAGLIISSYKFQRWRSNLEHSS